MSAQDIIAIWFIIVFGLALLVPLFDIASLIRRALQ